MEKPFPIGPFLQFCRLLTALSFFLMSAGLWALSGNEEPLTVLVETSADTPIQGKLWTITVLVDFVDPKGVTVENQKIPSTFVLERIRTAPRLVPDSGGNQTIWTAVEYLLLPQEEGDFIVGPFRVSAGGREAFTSAVDVHVSPAPSEPARSTKIRLRWSHIPRNLQVARPSDVYLAVENLPSSQRKSLRTPEYVVPENALMEYVSAKNYSENGTVVLCFQIIPLNSNPIKLDSVKVPLESDGLFAPSLTLSSIAEAPKIKTIEKPTTVSPGLKDAETPVASPSPSRASGSAVVPPFPSFPDPSIPSFLRPSYQRVLERGKRIWNSGDPVAALAWVRKAERDQVVGPFLMRPRGAMERALGLRAMENERWVPVGLLTLLGVGSFVLSLMSVLVFRAAKKKRRDTNRVTFFASYGYIVSVFFLAVAFIVFVYGAAQKLPSWGLGIGRGGALTRSTAAYRLPEKNSVLSAHFADGQVVRIISSVDRWAYVEKADGGAGWVPENRLVRY